LITLSGLTLAEPACRQVGIKKSVMKNLPSFAEFCRQFSTSESCHSYLFDLKWSCGYECRKCGHTEPKKGRTRYHNRCKACGYDESATAHTLFHKLKFPIESAFMITYQLCTMKKGLSSCEIARLYNIHQGTAWYFRRKVQCAMKASDSPLLGGCVEVDETVIGGREKLKQGRSHGKKKKVMVAIEIDYPEDDGPAVLKNSGSRVIEDFSSSSLEAGIDELVENDALVITDGWKGYSGAMKARWHEILMSDQGANFPHLHWHIFNLKNWLRGIHHSVSLEHIESYLDEFNFRFNRRNHKNRPQFLLDQMVKLPWMTRQMLKAA
jgi:transposase-like protein